MTFTEEQQKLYRDLFIEESNQKAWGAACNADWISKGLEKIVADYEKLTAEDAKLAEEIKTLEAALDAHTKDDRDKRKALQQRRDTIAKGTQVLQVNMQQGQQALGQLYQSVETNLALAKHAEGWEWREVKIDK